MPFLKMVANKRKGMTCEKRLGIVFYQNKEVINIIRCSESLLPSMFAKGMKKQEAERLEHGSNNLKVPYSPQWQRIWRYVG